KLSATAQQTTTAVCATRIRASRTLASVAKGRGGRARATPKARGAPRTPMLASASVAARVAAPATDAATGLAVAAPRSTRKTGTPENDRAASAMNSSTPSIPALTAVPTLRHATVGGAAPIRQ